MDDLPVLEWDAGHGAHADVAELSVVKLMAWDDRWRVLWYDDHATGDATSRADARERARQFAQVLLRQVHAQLARVYDSATDRVVIMPDAPDAEVRHG